MINKETSQLIINMARTAAPSRASEWVINYPWSGRNGSQKEQFEDLQGEKTRKNAIPKRRKKRTLENIRKLVGRGDG